MRELKFTRNYLKYPAGSCLAEFGDTRVICTASIEDSVPPFLKGSGKGWLSAEYSMLPGSTGGGRKKRSGAKPDGRGIEIQRLIGRSLRAAVNLDALGERSIIIDCDVLQADGGTRTAAISGAWVALVDALAGLEDAGILKGRMAAVSVGIVDGQVHCDLDYSLDSRAEVDMNVVMLEHQLVEVQGTGERSSFDRLQLDALLDAAREGIEAIYRAQQAALDGERPQTADSSATSTAAPTPDPSAAVSREGGLDFLPDFRKRGGLLPCVVQDHVSREILMLGYVNQEALDLSLKNGYASFYSTSRGSLWTKGESSGNRLRLVDVLTDCDQDSLVYLVEQGGEGACHTTGSDGKPRLSCFYRRLEKGGRLAFLEGRE